MSTTPKVSVIIPVYNAEEHLLQCLDSVNNQTFADLEIICVDDGSSDSSLDILNRYACEHPNCKVYTQRNQFAGVARNHGLKYAQGKYIAFLDSDDYYANDAIEKLYNIAEQYHAEVVKGNFYFLNAKNGEIYESKYSRNGYVDDINRNRAVSFSDAPEQLIYIADVPWNGLYLKSFLDNNKIRFNNLRCVNDHSFFVDCLIHAKRLIVSDVYVAYYRVEQKNSLIGTRAKHYENQLDSYNIVKSFCRELPENLSWIVLERELDAVFGWYHKICSNLSDTTQLDSQLQQFVNSFSVTDVSPKFFDHFQYRDIYLKFKSSRGKDENSFCKLSIIVPVFNAEPYLSECLNSLVNQTLTDIEIICVDDASTDNSLAILKEYAYKDSRIHIIAHSQNKHQGGARNSGLDIANGKYTWFVDADDFIDSDAAEYLVKIMESMGDIDVLGFEATAFRDTLHGRISVAEKAISRNWPKNQIISLPEEQDILPDKIEGSSVVYIAKRTFINQFRFRENVYFEDADFSFKVYTSNAKYYFIDYAPYHRRVTATSTTGDTADGVNPETLMSRIWAAKAIAEIIEEKHFADSYFAVQWFKRWARYAIELYLAQEELYTDQLNCIIKNLQSTFLLYSYSKILASASLRKIFLPHVVVSLTTYPKRLPTVYKVIKSILEQTVSVDLILLYVAMSEIAREDIPRELLSLTQKDETFRIIFCENLKPHKKYFYAMQEYQDSIIITVDDDVIYEKNLVERLLTSYLQYPDCVSCMRAHTIEMIDMEHFAPYNKWQETHKIVGIPSYRILPTGVGGVLYPPHCLPPKTFDKEKIYGLCLNADDLWLKYMQLQANVRSILLQSECVLRYIDGTQDDALWLDNVRKNQNDVTWNKILDSEDPIHSLKAKLLIYSEQIQATPVKNREFDQLFRERNYYRDELARVRSSWTYRIGRFITFIPRKVRGGLCCYQEHGLSYTWNRLLVHLHLKDDPYKKR